MPGALASEPRVFRYNNNAYYLPGVVVEAAAGKRYAENKKQYIVAATGMQDSGIFDGRTILSKLAQGTVLVDDGRRELPPYVNPSLSCSAAGVYSTAPNLVRFDSALAGGRPRKQASQREIYADRG